MKGKTKSAINKEPQWIWITEILTKINKKISFIKLHLSANYYNSNMNENTVKPVYKGHSREPENAPFMSSSPLYIQVINICTIH